jgi:uncharacterized protein (TIGR02646 family)
LKFADKGEPPESFVTWKKQERNTGRQPDFGSLQNPEKSDVVQALLREQMHLCVYCGRSLQTNPSNCHIDHFWPQSYFNGVSGPDRRLDHDNLFLSCGPTPLPGGAARTYPQTCGDAKADWFDQRSYVIPSDPRCEARFAYTAAGEILSKDDRNGGANNMIERLSLNDAILVYERKKLIGEIENELGRSKGVLDNMEEIIATWRTPSREGRLAGFAQVVYGTSKTRSNVARVTDRGQTGQGPRWTVTRGGSHIGAYRVDRVNVARIPRRPAMRGVS